MKYWSLLLFIFVANSAWSSYQFEDLPRYLDEGQYYQCAEFAPKRPIKVAIIDLYFGDNLEEKRGKSLPLDFEVLNPEYNQSEDMSGYHAFYTAEVLHEYMSRGGECPENSAKMYLIPYSGYTQFSEAVDAAIAKDVDVILYTIVWNAFGNGDGTGFINQVANRALDAGITWINAAGNFQRNVWQGDLKRADGQLTFGREDKLYIECMPSEGNECSLLAYLSWNDFKNDPEQGTTKDLNFVLVDEVDEKVRSSSRIQMQSLEQANKIGNTATIYPYEFIRISPKDRGRKLKKGRRYAFKIYAESTDWSYEDFFRLSVEGEGIRLLSPSPDKPNTIFPPADNPRVISVGAYDAELSSYYERGSFLKPEILGVSKIVRDNKTYLGSSVTATLYAAQFALLKNRMPNASEEEVRRAVETRFQSYPKCNYEIDIGPDFGAIYDLKQTGIHLKAVVGPEMIYILTPSNPYRLFGIEYSSYKQAGYSLDEGFTTWSSREIRRLDPKRNFILLEDNGSYRTCPQ
tara:strand:+ start:18433 stop:19983 length:1551 start_codon:yes stop_codon:yes gene_type:complete